MPSIDSITVSTYCSSTINISVGYKKGLSIRVSNMSKLITLILFSVKASFILS